MERLPVSMAILPATTNASCEFFSVISTFISSSNSSLIYELQSRWVINKLNIHSNYSRDTTRIVNKDECSDRKKSNNFHILVDEY